MPSCGAVNMSSESVRVLVVAHPDGANQEWVGNMAKSGRNGGLRSNVTSLEQPLAILGKRFVGMPSRSVNPKKVVRGEYLVSHLLRISYHREALSATCL
jgi:hypothetical protein